MAKMRHNRRHLVFSLLRAPSQLCPTWRMFLVSPISCLIKSIQEGGEGSLGTNQCVLGSVRALFAVGIDTFSIVLIAVAARIEMSSSLRLLEAVFIVASFWIAVHGASSGAVEALEW